MSTTHIGRCTCGNIEFEFTGNPLRTFLCYCTECQRTTGSENALLTLVPAKAFQLKKGAPSIYKRPGSSGKDVVIHFCGDCGAGLYGEVTAYGLVSIATARLEDTSRHQPTIAQYTASAPAWSAIPPGIATFEGRAL